MGSRDAYLVWSFVSVTDDKPGDASKGLYLKDSCKFGILVYNGIIFVLLVKSFSFLTSIKMMPPRTRVIFPWSVTLSSFSPPFSKNRRDSFGYWMLVGPCILAFWCLLSMRRSIVPPQ